MGVILSAFSDVGDEVVPGPEVKSLMGDSVMELVPWVLLMFCNTDDGASVAAYYRLPNNKLVLMYLRREGAKVYLGTRRDFERLGWPQVCNHLDDYYQVHRHLEELRDGGEEVITGI